MTRPGMTRKSPPFNPSGTIAKFASRGPSAKPTLPPVAKNAMPLARRAPLAWPATFIASG